MKKIIAMLLCVALVAAMGVTAFAGTPGAPDSKTEVFTIQEWYDYLNTEVVLTGLNAYAASLAHAKEAYKNEIAAWNGLKTRIATAVQAAQYAAIAAYVDAAWQIAQAEATNALNEALASFAIDLEDLYEPDPALWFASVGENNTNSIFFPPIAG